MALNATALAVPRRLVQWYAALMSSVILAAAQSALPLRAAAGAPKATKPDYQGAGKTRPNAVKNSRYQGSSSEEILANRLQALRWSDQTRQTIAPAMHLIETEHFLIFSAWDRSNDKALADVSERMHEQLGKQFNLSPTETVWVGKCPIFVFWDTAQFRRFAAEVDRSSRAQPKAARSDGYHATRGRLSYIVINGVKDLGASTQQATTRFFEVLVHEGTHGFVSRYISDRSLPLWVEEGLADYMAATLVPAGGATRKCTAGARHALQTPNALSSLFSKNELTSIDYGIAQSVIRYLIALDGRTFVQFVERMKRGTSADRALAESYRMSRDQLLRNWALFWRQYLARSST